MRRTALLRSIVRLCFDMQRGARLRFQPKYVDLPDSEEGDAYDDAAAMYHRIT